MDDIFISKKLRRLRYLFRVGMAITATLLILFFGFIYLIISVHISFGPTSYISIMNLEDETITVNNHNLKIFETFTSQSNIRKEFKVENPNQEVISYKILPNRQNSALTIFINSSLEYCFFSADVSSFYYVTDSIENTLVNVLVLDSKEEKVEMLLDLNNYEYLYPGKYSTSDLPENLIDKKLIGIYPIRCDISLDPEQQKSTVLFYRNYNPGEQFEYYNSQINELSKQLQ